METALREVVIAYLREQGFRGTFPHFRRPRATHIDLLTFQFFSSGGSFVVELAACAPTGVVHSWGKVVPPGKVTAHDVQDRHRLGSEKFDDHWFRFGKPNYEVGHDIVGPAKQYVAVAEAVRQLLVEEGESSWRRAARESKAADKRRKGARG